MRFDKRANTPWRALIHLGMPRSWGVPMAQISEIAQKEKTSRSSFWNSILVAVEEGGFLDSKARQGGRVLSREAAGHDHDGDVVRHLGWPLAPIPCVSQNFYERCNCPTKRIGGLRKLMLDVRNDFEHPGSLHARADGGDHIAQVARDGLIAASAKNHEGHNARLDAIYRICVMLIVPQTNAAPKQVDSRWGTFRT